MVYATSTRCALSYCTSVYTCGSDEQQLSFFTFPKDPTRCALWVENCNPLYLPTIDNTVMGKNFKLCGLHFENTCFSNFQKNRLFANAVPTLFERNVVVKSTATTSTSTNKDDEAVIHVSYIAVDGETEIYDQIQYNTTPDLINLVMHPRIPRVFRQRSDYFECLRDFEFVDRFRLSKCAVLYVHGLIQYDIEHPTDSIKMKLPGGTRCALVYCNSVYTKNPFEQQRSLSFFSFPKDPIRCSLWIEKCNPVYLPSTNTRDYISHYKLCSLHFEYRMFSNFQKNRLFPHAVPTLFGILNRPMICEDVSSEISSADISVSEHIVFDDLDVTITPSKQMPSTIPLDSTTNTLNGVSNEITVPSVEDLCRLCAKNHKDMVSICGNENINHNLESKIHKFLPFINLNESDFPKRICFGCFSTVTAFNNLWETSKETNEKLNSLVFDAKNKVKVNQENNITLNDNDDDDGQSLLMETDMHILTADNSSEEIIEECVIETVSNEIRTNSNEEGDNQNGIKQGSILLDALLRPPSHGNQNNTVTTLKLDHNYTLVSKPKPKWLWRLAPADKNTIDHTYAMWQWEKISINLSETTVKTPSEQTSFVCNNCPASYSEKSLLTKHMSVMHKKSKRLKCLKNKEMKTTTRKLLVIKCNKCGRKFRQQNELDKHRCRSKEERAATAAFYARFRVDIDGQQVYKCDQCPYYTKSRNSQLSFRQHYSLHSTGFDLMCDKCPKKFRTLNALKTHVEIVHLQVKKYSCFQCGKKFGALGTLKTHLLMHSGERPYMCDECGKTFRHLSKLRIHTRFVHQKEKKHRCPMCDKPYFTASLVNAHIRSTHTHVRDHVCQICQKAFYTRNNLWSHNQQVHSNPDKFICNLCDKTFKVKRYYILHCKKKHNLIEPQT